MISNKTSRSTYYVIRMRDAEGKLSAVRKQHYADGKAVFLRALDDSKLESVRFLKVHEITDTEDMGGQALLEAGRQVAEFTTTTKAVADKKAALLAQLAELEVA